MLGAVPKHESLMTEILHYDLQLEAIRWLQHSPFSLLNGFWVFLNKFDSKQFYFGVGIAAAIFLTRKDVLRIWWLLALAIYFTSFLKLLFELPRPLILDPSVGLVGWHDSFGLPSGGANASMVIGLFVYLVYPRWGTALLAAAYVLLIGFSRVYIGMHFFTDILGGWLVGGTLVFCRIAVEHAGRSLTVPRILSLVLALGFSFMLYLMYPHGKPTEFVVAIALGLSLGSFWSQRSQVFGAPLVSLNAVRVGIGLLLIVLVSLSWAESPIFLFLRLMLAGVLVAGAMFVIPRWVGERPHS